MTFLKGITMETCLVIFRHIVPIEENGLTRAGARDQLSGLAPGEPIKFTGLLYFY